MNDEYMGIAAGFVLAAVITGAMVTMASTLGKKKPSTVRPSSAAWSGPSSICGWPFSCT